jgi:hypothetical protein
LTIEAVPIADPHEPDPEAPTSKNPAVEWVLARALDGRSAHFGVDLAPCDELAAELERRVTKSLAAPRPPGRLRHFEACPPLAACLAECASRAASPQAVLVDLLVPSVLCDAGAGPSWRFVKDGLSLARSEGLAAATLELFLSGALADDDASARTDGAALASLGDAAFARAFQLGPANHLRGAPRRLELLRRLGAALLADAELFPGGRPSGLLAWVSTHRPSAVGLARRLVRALSSVWPPRQRLPEEPPGDVFSSARFAPSERHLFAFHKLTLFLVHSLAEPLADFGVPLVGFDALPPMPEYRSGGLLLDGGVLAPRGEVSGAQVFDGGLVVEWRALTVALLTRLRAPLLERFAPEQDRAARAFEAAVWSLGRDLAHARRPGGEPPIIIDGDGELF